MVIFNYTGHLVIGSAAGYYVAKSPILFMAVLIGALLVDIDHPQSTVGRYNPFVGFMKHRGHCHSILGTLLLALPFLLIQTEAIKGTDMYAMVTIGELSHLVGDKIYSWLPGKSEFKIKIW